MRRAKGQIAPRHAFLFRRNLRPWHSITRDDFGSLSTGYDRERSHPKALSKWEVAVTGKGSGKEAQPRPGDLQKSQRRAIKSADRPFDACQQTNGSGDLLTPSTPDWQASTMVYIRLVLIAW